MTIVLDSGAIIAHERNDARLTALFEASRQNRVPVILPATVVAETWRGATTHPLAARFVGSIDECPILDEAAAKRVGALIARAKTIQIVDGNVVDLAISMRPSTIVTSDPDDISRLLSSKNVSWALAGSPPKNADVVVIAL